MATRCRSPPRTTPPTVDGDPSTAWSTGGFSSAKGERLRIHYRKAVTTDQLRVLQSQGGFRNRFITGVDVRLDGGDPLHFDLGAASRDAVAGDKTPGQTLKFDRQRFSRVDITITATDRGELRRYDGVTTVGLAEVVPGGAPPSPTR